MSDPQDRRKPKGAFDASKTLVLPHPGGSPQAAVAEAVTREPWQIQVEVLGGPMDGLRNRVSAPTFRIGREVENDLALTLDPMVSAHHAKIVREGNHYWLEDLESRNGVYLGDQRLGERVLIGAGTAFVVGRTELEFMPR